jgi:hypothetical protein
MVLGALARLVMVLSIGLARLMSVVLSQCLAHSRAFALDRFGSLASHL